MDPAAGAASEETVAAIAVEIVVATAIAGDTGSVVAAVAARRAGPANVGALHD